MPFLSISEVLDAEFSEALRLSPPAPQTPATEPWRLSQGAVQGGTNYLQWLAVRLFLENQKAV